MKLTFIGADHEVTGSCHCLNVCGKNILVDCGMEQGRDIYENQKLPMSPSEVDCVLLTHAHIDHSGLLPLLYAQGFRGPIYTTEATSQLCDIMLRDSAHIQEFEAEWRNRKGKRAGQEPYVPVYTMQDAMGAIGLLKSVPYEAVIDLFDGVKIRFRDVGHLLGSASIEVWMNEDGVEKKIVFSGDIGNKNQPLINDPRYVDEADYVVMESTYGDRYHGERPDYVGQLTQIIQSTFDKGGNVVIPCFAVGRTQEILYFIRQIKAENRIKGHDNFPVFVDSPLAIDATGVFMKNEISCYDDEAKALVDQGINPIQFPGLKTAITSEESKLINFDNEPKVILSASGMCEAGRIRHHLKHNLWRPESTIVFVGYQAEGTLGRSLYEGAESVKLFGEPIAVNASIVTLEGISGHADKNGLLEWVKAIKDPKKVFIVHGEDTVTEVFASTLRDELGLDAEAPFSGACFDLAAGEWLVKTVGERKIKVEHKHAISSTFERLLAAGQRLLTVIRHNEGGTNKDLGKFADQINSLCDKWDR